MPRQRGRRDECPSATLARAAQRLSHLVHAGVGVLSDVVRAAEEPLAFRADVVHLVVMLLELLSSAEQLYMLGFFRVRTELG